MSELAVLSLIVDSKKQTPDPGSPYPVIAFDPESGATWNDVKKQIMQSGAQKVLLQFSNETIDIPAHNWNHIDYQFRRFHRLYDSVDIITSVSPLIFIDLFAPLPLPGLSIVSREINFDEYGWKTTRLLYFFDTHNWDQLEIMLSKNNLHIDDLFALSCLYEQTNRFEEAYAASLKALTLEESAQTNDRQRNGTPLSELPIPVTQDLPMFDPARLWLAHGLHAARCNRNEEAATAFRMSYAENPHMDPLYYWADELIRQGFSQEEAIIPIVKWLETDPDKEERYIRLLHRIGLFSAALKSLEQITTASHHQITRIYFDCLIQVGRIAEAALLFHEQDEAYKKKYPTDALLYKILLADDNLSALISPLAQYELVALQDRAVSIRLFSYAETLQGYISEPLSLAFTLFRNGYVMRSATHFLQALKNNTMVQDGYRCLGEILYYRGAYQQASEMFEYLLSQAPDNAALRTALALACLRQSEVLLKESMYIFPSSVFLREESEKVGSGIKRMEQSAAITRWKWAERTNFHG
ncbi:hypothetical protein [Paenibacillus radicis (ex Xue et al. 2023)]|uniref:Tetratricopeptide repeat protein n=1 Tax=Paenibacillus radicis (ex Xue et al. 2023) TaxID=2972489 RepID=A0ABT1YQN0_9BACL|nr:hypothetical protein [Paenibacillus radicis (ex Xue et al. 2023)]MCR8635030.1 hypothetical protein [Paenibacillus radicis (ex Xue et al. 2023)]